MADFFEWKRRAETIMKQSEALAGKLGYDTSAQSIRNTLEAFRKKELMVVAVGEARRGKSTLLNALLNEKNPVFPVDINVCTNVVTVVRYGVKEKVEACVETEKGDCRREIIEREQIPEYVSEQGNPGNYKNVKLLNIELPNPLLKEGVVFVDTPGVGSLNVSHAEAACGFLPAADLLLFVSDAGAGLTESELGFLRRGWQYCKNIIFPLTKKDANPDYQTIAENNRDKIQMLLGVTKDSVQIIPVSSTAKLRYLERGSRSMYANSNFQVLEKTIWNSIAAARASVLILPFLTAVKEELWKLDDSLAAQYQLLSADQSKTGEMIETLNAEIRRMEECQQKSAEWRNQIGYFFSLLTNEIHEKLQEISLRARELLEREVTEQGKKICEEAQYKDVLSQINEEISGGILDVKTYIEQRMEEEAGQIEAELGLDLNMSQAALDQMSFEPGQEVTVVFQKRKKMDRVITGGRKITMNSMGGAAVGAIIGGFIGLCFGGPAGLMLGAQYGSGAGTLVGGTKGCVEALEQYDELDVGRVNRTLQQHIATTTSSAGTKVSNTVAALRMQLVTSFEEKIKTRVKELQENIRELQNNIRLTKEGIPQKQNALKQQSGLIRQQLEQCEKLEQAAAALRERPAKSTPPVREQPAVPSAPKRKEEEESGGTYQFL